MTNNLQPMRSAHKVRKLRSGRPNSKPRATR